MRFCAEPTPYLETEPAGPRLLALVQEARANGIRTVDYIVALNRRVHEKVRYLIRLEPGVQTSEQTLELQSGSCRDTAWLLVQLSRHLGMAVRFVSGYLIQLKTDIPALDGPSGPEADFTDLHAWAEVYLPGAGWVGLDPTSGLWPARGTSRWPAPPTRSPPCQLRARIRGTRAPSATPARWNSRTLAVKRVHEDPRVTNPTPRTNGRRSRNSGTRSIAILKLATCG